MSQRANYFKLGLFVIGAIAAGIIVLLIIGTGRFLQKRVTVETYFNESVQGLDIGSKMKYRGVDVGQVTRISFTYVKYEQDKPMGDRKRYVLVEAQIQPRLVGGRAANDIASAESTAIEVEKGLRIKLAPQGITGTSYLEVDYVDPGTNPSFKKLPDTADQALQKVRDLVADPKLAASITHMERTLSRLDRIFGGGEADLATTIENLRQISDNLRDLTEDAKRYPSGVIFG